MITFTVHGKPATQGSKRAFAYRGKDGRHHAAVVDNSGERLKSWRAAVADAAIEAYQGDPVEGPVSVVIWFAFQRPKSHYRHRKAGPVLRDDAPFWHVARPDATKLARAVEDALTGILWRDDSQIAFTEIRKYYDQSAHASVTVTPLTEMAKTLP